MFVKFLCWAGLGLYALLSVADWTLTFALLRAHPGAVESNPFAAAFLEQYGWRGLALYKTAVVVVFVASVVMIFRRRPAVATAVVALGCAALLWVTTYSHGLLTAAHREAADLAAAEWPPPKQPLASDPNDLPDRCWFAPEKLSPTRTAAAPRRLPAP